jgi:hypothetical protein
MGLRYDIAFTTKELSRVLDKPTTTSTSNEIVNRALIYSYRTKDAHLRFSSLLMKDYTPPQTRRKPTDAITVYDVEHFNTYDGIKHVDETEHDQTYIHPGESLTLTCLTDIDLAGQPDTRQSTSAYTLYLNGTMFHWRAHTEKLIIKSTASGEYIALSRGNQACKHVREILNFFGNTKNIYHLYTDNQAAEHIATQPNMTDHSRSIDIRHHEIKQDYVEGGMRIGGVSSANNTADILTKNLQPPFTPNIVPHCTFSTLPSLPTTSPSTTWLPSLTRKTHLHRPNNKNDEQNDNVNGKETTNSLHTRATHSTTTTNSPTTKPPTSPHSSTKCTRTKTSSPPHTT